MSLPVHFAPIQGYTDHFYRSVHASTIGGISVYYAPFMRWEKGDIRKKDIVDILPENNANIHLIPQIICGTTEEFNHLSDAIQKQGYQEIDINMGCPAPMQTKLKRGSGILPYPHLVEAILNETKKRNEVHFSVKMRLGWEKEDEWKTLLPILNDFSLSHITLHPRTGRQQYKGEIWKEVFQSFCQQCQHSVIYNGDLTTLSLIESIEKEFPTIKGIMLGRGLLARPTLAQEYSQGCEWNEKNRTEFIQKMHEELFRFYKKKYISDSQTLIQMHPFWEYQSAWLDKRKYKRIMKAGSMRNYIAAVAEL